MLLKTMEKKTNKQRKTDLFSGNKLNRIEKSIFKALIDSDICPKEFTLGINEEQNYLRLKESFRIKDNQLGDIERHRTVEYG